MNPLVAIMTCHQFRDRANAQRDTWVKDIPEKLDYRFFLGKKDGYQPLADEVMLDAPDDYRNFPLKVQAMRRWARERGYTLVLKTDCDSYIVPERLIETIPTRDYVGRLRGPSDKYPAPYCSGFSYWNSAKALDALIATPWNGDFAEDRFTGNALLAAGIQPDHDPRFAVVFSKNNALSFREPPLQGNKIAAACEFNPTLMRQVHADFKAGKQSRYIQRGISRGSLDRVCVMMKTFLRDGYMFASTRGLEQNFPDVKVVLVDDGYESFEKITYYAELRHRGHVALWLPFDSGFGAKANAAIPLCDREFVLIGSDDFDFSDHRVRPGIDRMVSVLDSDPSIGICSGRVDNTPYESKLVIEGDTIREVPGYHSDFMLKGFKVALCDLTVNYSLIRRSVLDQVRWDGGEVKIGGGEHGAFFLDVKRAGWKVAVVEGANIYQMKFNPTWMAKDYRQMRARAQKPGRPCLKKRGINKWVCQDGRVELA